MRVALVEGEWIERLSQRRRRGYSGGPKGVAARAANRVASVHQPLEPRQRNRTRDLSRYGVAPLEDHFWRKAGELIARATQPREFSPES
jgi:hypothetical protein